MTDELPEPKAWGWQDRASGSSPVGVVLDPRATLGPDDYRGGFAVWSGTSFAAPYAAGLIAAALGDVPAREARGRQITRSRRASRSALETLEAQDGSRT